jgi:hypothetical protein
MIVLIARRKPRPWLECDEDDRIRRDAYYATRAGSCPRLGDVIDTTGASGSATGAVLDL